jgi:transcriptional regulator
MNSPRSNSLLLPQLFAELLVKEESLSMDRTKRRRTVSKPSCENAVRERKNVLVLLHSSSSDVSIVVPNGEKLVQEVSNLFSEMRSESTVGERSTLET